MTDKIWRAKEGTNRYANEDLEKERNLHADDSRSGSIPNLCESNGSACVCARMCAHALRSRGDNKTWGIGHGCLQTGDK